VRWLPVQVDLPSAPQTPPPPTIAARPQQGRLAQGNVTHEHQSCEEHEHVGPRVVTKAGARLGNIAVAPVPSACPSLSYC